MLPQPVMVANWIIGFHLFSLCYNNDSNQVADISVKSSNVKSRRVKNLEKARDKQYSMKGKSENTGENIGLTVKPIFDIIIK
jgi:hypothetical protein